MSEKFYPAEYNLGKDCKFWGGLRRPDGKLASYVIGCTYPKSSMKGRLSCEGCVDDVCLFLKDGRRPPSLTDEQLDKLRRRIPFGDNRDVPPGDIH